jgi:acyl-CoA synthetase (AMP-forming)/AMP-acid ligase II
MNIAEYLLARAGTGTVWEHTTGLALSGAGLTTAAERVAQLPGVRERKQTPTLVEVDLTVASLVALLGVVLSGGIAVPMPSRVLAHRLARTLDVTGADAALVDPRRPSPLQHLLAESGQVRAIPVADLDDLFDADHDPMPRAPSGPPPSPSSEAGSGPKPPPSWELPAAVGHDNDPAVILLTSGTTGVPKGVTLTHGNVIANLEAIRLVVALGVDDLVTLALPLQYSFGLSTTLLTLAVGANGVFLPPLQFPDEFVTAMTATRPTVFAGVPGHYQALLGRPGFTAEELPSLRTALQAGGPMPEDLTRRFAAAFPRCALHLMYGQTEATARLTTLPAELALTDPTSVGPPLPGVALEIRDPNGRLLPPGEVGEVYARGPNVMAGYWNDPRGTAATLTEHGLRTGDLGRLDRAGQLHLTGRCSELAKVRGERLAAREIEDVIRAVDGVLDAVVQVGRRATQVDDVLRGLLLLADPAGAAATLSRVKRAVLAGFGPAVVPHLVVVDTLPLTESGKKVRHYRPDDDS